MDKQTPKKQPVFRGAFSKVGYNIMGNGINGVQIVDKVVKKTGTCSKCGEILILNDTPNAWEFYCEHC